MTRIIRLQERDKHKLESALEPAAATIRQGGLIIVPTETVYGLAANALDGAAVQRVFDVKGRETGVPLPVQVAGLADVHRWVTDIPPEVERMMSELCPGPLTVVLRKSEAIPDIVTGGQPTIGIRIPNHPVTLCLLKMTGVPLIMTSANLSGHAIARTAAEAIGTLGEKVDVIVDGDLVEDFRRQSGRASTVVDVTMQPPRVLRAGPVTAEELRRFLPDLVEGA